MGSLISVGDSSRTHLVFDNILKEGYTSTAQVSNHPMGSRSKPADHRLDEPKVIEIVGRITESPFALAEGRPPPLFLDDVNGPLESDAAELIQGLTTAEGNRPRALIVDLFIDSFKNGLWEYSSAGMGLKRNLVLVSWDFVVERARHTDFNIRLQEVEFIEAQRVALPELKVLKKAPETCPQVGTGDKAKTNLGTLGTLGTPSTVNPKDTSALKSITDAISGSTSNADLLAKIQALSFK